MDHNSLPEPQVQVSTETEAIRIGLIGLLSTDDQEQLNTHGRLIEKLIGDPRLKVISHCIAGHPVGLPNDDEERRAIPKVVSLGRTMEREDGVRAIFISGALDPGVSQLREVVHIPVIGAGSAAAAIALALGRPVGVLTLTGRIPAVVQDILGKMIVASAKPPTAKTALDLRTERVRLETLEMAAKLIKDGAEVILLACTGFSTINTADYLERELGVRVIDPVIAGGLLAYYAATGCSGTLSSETA